MRRWIVCSNLRRLHHVLPLASSHSRYLYFTSAAAGALEVKKKVRAPSSSSSLPSVSKRIVKLRSILKKAASLYYNAGNSNITDPEYDQFIVELKQLESDHPQFKTSDSPTVQIGAPLDETATVITTTTTKTKTNSTAIVKHKHRFAMLSLNNVNNDADLLSFLQSTMKQLSVIINRQSSSSSVIPLSYCLELKYDGMAISLLYKAGQLYKAVSRGDGIVGEDLTKNVKRWVKNLPISINLQSIAQLQILDQKQVERIKTMLNGEFEVRGEVIMTKKAYEEYQSRQQPQLEENKLESDSSADQQQIRSPRNLTVGLMRRTGENGEDLETELQIICYSLHLPDDQQEIIDSKLNPTSVTNQPILPIPLPTPPLSLTPSLLSHSGRISLLRHLSFPICAFAQILNNDQSILLKYHEVEAKRSELPYDIDGVVVKVDSLAFQILLASTSLHPRWAIAAKFKSAAAITTVTDIRMQVGRTGKLTPVADVGTIVIGGVQVSKVNLHGFAWMKNMGVTIGATVEIERKGDVIPQITRLITPAIPSSSSSTSSQYCPCSEKSELLLKDSEYYCVSPSCPAQFHRSILHYCSRSGFNITALGTATILQLMKLKQLTSLQSLPLIALNPHSLIDVLSKTKGWKSQSINRLIENIIQSHRSVDDATILLAIGITGLGKETAKRVCTELGGLKGVRAATELELQEVKGIGKKSSEQIVTDLQQSSQLLDTIVHTRTQLNAISH